MGEKTLRHRLRAATWDQHELLHRDPMLASLADGSIEPDDYTAVMTRLGRFYCAIDDVVLAGCRQFRCGLNGYVYRPRGGMFQIRAPARLDLPPIRSAAALAGTCYVLDGAVLGGKVMARAMPCHHPFFDWCASNGPGIWRDAKRLIDHVDTDSAAANAAIQAACLAFDAFATAMNAANRQV